MPPFRRERRPATSRNRPEFARRLGLFEPSPFSARTVRKLFFRFDRFDNIGGCRSGGSRDRLAGWCKRFRSGKPHGATNGAMLRLRVQQMRRAAVGRQPRQPGWRNHDRGLVALCGELWLPSSIAPKPHAPWQPSVAGSRAIAYGPAPPSRAPWAAFVAPSGPYPSVSYTPTPSLRANREISFALVALLSPFAPWPTLAGAGTEFLIETGRLGLARVAEDRIPGPVRF